MATLTAYPLFLHKVLKIRSSISACLPESGYLALVKTAILTMLVIIHNKVHNTNAFCSTCQILALRLISVHHANEYCVKV